MQLSGLIDTYLQLSAEKETVFQAELVRTAVGTASGDRTTCSLERFAEIIRQALDCHPCSIETRKPNIAAKEAVNSGCAVVERDDGGAMVLN